MDNRRKRLSILKKSTRYETSPTQTFTKSNRRISFSGTKSIKEFIPGDDKATIWGTSYEEEDGHQASGAVSSKEVTDNSKVMANKNFAISVDSRLGYEIVSTEDKENIGIEACDTMELGNTQNVACSFDNRTFNRTIDITLNVFEQEHLKIGRTALSDKAQPSVVENILETKDCDVSMDIEADVSRSFHCSFINAKDWQAIKESNLVQSEKSMSPNTSEMVDDCQFVGQNSSLRAFRNIEEKQNRVEHTSDSLDTSCSIGRMSIVQAAELEDDKKKTCLFPNSEDVSKIAAKRQTIVFDDKTSALDESHAETTTDVCSKCHQTLYLNELAEENMETTSCKETATQNRKTFIFPSHEIDTDPPPLEVSTHISQPQAEMIVYSQKVASRNIGKELTKRETILLNNDLELEESFLQTMSGPLTKARLTLHFNEKIEETTKPINKEEFIESRRTLVFGNKEIETDENIETSSQRNDGVGRELESVRNIPKNSRETIFFENVATLEGSFVNVAPDIQPKSNRQTIFFENVHTLDEPFLNTKCDIQPKSNVPIFSPPARKSSPDEEPVKGKHMKRGTILAAADMDETIDLQAAGNKEQYTRHIQNGPDVQPLFQSSPVGPACDETKVEEITEKHFYKQRNDIRKTLIFNCENIEADQSFEDQMIAKHFQGEHEATKDFVSEQTSRGAVEQRDIFSGSKDHVSRQLFGQEEHCAQLKEQLAASKRHCFANNLSNSSKQEFKRTIPLNDDDMDISDVGITHLIQSSQQKLNENRKTIIFSGTESIDEFKTCTEQESFKGSRNKRQTMHFDKDVELDVSLCRADAEHTKSSCINRSGPDESYFLQKIDDSDVLSVHNSHTLCASKSMLFNHSGAMDKTKIDLPRHCPSDTTLQDLSIRRFNEVLTSKDRIMESSRVLMPSNSIISVHNSPMFSLVSKEFTHAVQTGDACRPVVDIIDLEESANSAATNEKAEFTRNKRTIDSCGMDDSKTLAKVRVVDRTRKSVITLSPCRRASGSQLLEQSQEKRLPCDISSSIGVSVENDVHEFMMLAKQQGSLNGGEIKATINCRTLRLDEHLELEQTTPDQSFNSSNNYEITTRYAALKDRSRIENATYPCSSNSGTFVVPAESEVAIRKHHTPLEMNRGTFTVLRDSTGFPDSTKNSNKKEFENISCTTLDTYPELLQKYKQDSKYIQQAESFRTMISTSTTFSPDTTSALCNLDPERLTGPGHKRCLNKSSTSNRTTYKQIKRDYADLTISASRVSPEQIIGEICDDIDNIENIHIDLVDTSSTDTLRAVSPGKDGVCEASVMILNAGTNNSSKYVQLLCRKCKNCQQSLLNDTTIADIHVEDDDSEQLELNFDELEKLMEKPRFVDVLNEFKERRLSNCFNSTYEDTMLFPTVPSAEFLLNNYAEGYTQKLNAEKQLKVGVAAVCPTIPPFEFLFRNRIETEKCNWRLDDEMLPIGLLECRHKMVRSVCLLVKFKPKDLYNLNADELGFSEVLLRKYNSYNSTTFDRVVENEIFLRVPCDLTAFCGSSSDLFKFLENIHDIFHRSHQLAKKLLKVTFLNRGMLQFDESKNIIVRKAIYSEHVGPNGGRIDFQIRIRNIEKICYNDILLPPPSYFKDSIRTLTPGLNFLNSFLSNPTNFFAIGNLV